MITTTSRDGGLPEYSTPSNWDEEPAAGIAEVLWEQAAEDGLRSAGRGIACI